MQVRLPRLQFGSAQPALVAASPPSDELRPSMHGACGCGKAWAEAASERLPSSGRRPIVYGLTSWREVDILRLVCTCMATREYDGAEDGVLNVNNLDLFSHELLRW